MAAKSITGIKHFKIKWFSNDNIEIHGYPLGKIIIDVIQFNDEIFLEKQIIHLHLYSTKLELVNLMEMINLYEWC